MFTVEAQVTARRGPQRSYGHRLRDLVRQSGDPGIAIRLGVPRSRAAGWLTGSRPSVLTIRHIEAADEAPRIELCRLQQGILRLTMLVRVLFAILRACHLDFAPSPDLRGEPAGQSASGAA